MGGRNATFAPVEDTYIQRGEGTAFGRKAQLKVDGSPESVALMKSDVSVEDTYIQRGEGTAFGRKAQLKVDGSPESVTLMKFDVPS